MRLGMINNRQDVIPKGYAVVVILLIILLPLGCKPKAAKPDESVKTDPAEYAYNVGNKYLKKEKVRRCHSRIFRGDSAQSQLRPGLSCAGCRLRVEERL